MFWVSSDKYPEVELLGPAILYSISIFTPAFYFHFREISSPFIYFQSVCDFWSAVGLLETVYVWILFPDSFSYIVSFD